MNLKLGFAVAVQYALVAAMFWMWVRKDRVAGWVFLAFLVYSWFVLPWIIASRNHMETMVAKLTFGKGLSRIGRLPLWG